MIGKPEECVRFLFQQDREKLFEIKEHKEKRSLNANNFLWHLCNEMANVLRTSKDEVYVEMLKRYGQSDVVSVVSTIDVSKYFKYYEEIGRATLQGKEFTHYRIYQGSSEYNTKEMAILIDGIISEAQELNIDVLPADEIERLKERWG